MTTLKITNPKTNREIRVRAWRIEPRGIVNLIRAGQIKTARDLSWMLLSGDDSIEEMQETDGGDCAANNWALSILENALDWTLGTKALGLIQSSVRDFRKLPKPFHVGCDRNGDVYLILASGRVLA